MIRRSARVEARADVENEPAFDFSNGMVTIHDPLGAASEAYRMLRTNLFYALVDAPPKVIVLTSPGPREGKSTTCANLGVTLAQAGKSVVILDCDLRKPAQHAHFGMRPSRGLVDVLAGVHSLQEVWQEPLKGLKVVPVGHVPPNPSELLSSQRFVEFLMRVRQEFDYVLLDTPPVCMASDSAILAKNGDAVLLVVDFKKSSKRPLRRAMSTLEGVGANVIGVVVNKVRGSRKDNVEGYGVRYYGAG